MKSVSSNLKMQVASLDDPSTKSTECFPIQCVTLHPLYGTPARLLVVDILCLKNVLGSNSLFVYKSHPVNNVRVSGIVTSLKKKEDCLVCNVDDGSGTIQCFCPLPVGDDKEVKTNGNTDYSRLSKSLEKRLSRNHINPIVLGDFVTVQGYLKLGMWNKHIHVNNCKWKVIDRSNTDDVWLELLKEQVSLYKQVYDETFCLDEKLQKASKSFFINEAYRQLYSSLEPIVKEFIAEAETTNEFFGYELLEMDEVKQAVTECANVSEKFDSNSYHLLTFHELRVISSSVVASLLHKQVISGHVIKKKCLKHEIVTNMDQMDSRYFITLRCLPVIKSVKEAITSIIDAGQSLSAYSVLHLFNQIEFNFIRSSKHGSAIVSVLMKQIMQQSV